MGGGGMTPISGIGGTQGNFNWGDLFGGQKEPAGDYVGDPARAINKPAQYGGGPQQAKNVNGVGSMEWMKWHPDYKPTPGTAAWGSTHPDPAQNVKYGSAQWQQTHPNYQAPPGLAQIGQPQNDLSDVIKHLFGGGQ